MHVRFSAGPRDGLRFHGQHAQIISQLAAALDGIETLGQFRILRGDAGGIGTVLVVVEKSGRSAELAVLLLVLGRVVAEGDQRRGADAHRVRAHRQRLGHVGARTDAA